MTQPTLPETLPASARRPWRRRALQGTLALALGGSSILGGGGIAALAQDGSGGATPIPTPTASCSIPDLSAARTEVQPAVIATVTATIAPASPAASPAHGTSNASPVVSATATTAAATPAASPATGTDDSIAAELTLSADAIADCLTKGDFTTLTSLTGDAFRGELIGAGEPVSAEDFAEIAPSLSVIPYAIVEVAGASASGSEATATVTYRIGNQVRVGEWAFTRETVDGKEVWALDRETAQAVTKPASATEASVTIEKNAYTFDPATIDGDEVFFTIANKDAVDHELFVVKLDKDTKVDVLLTTPGPGLPAGVSFVGQVTVPAGSTGTLLLADLEPGTYQVVDLLPNDQGLPHLSDGMQGTFTVK